MTGLGQQGIYHMPRNIRDEEEIIWDNLMRIVDSKLVQYKAKLAEREQNAGSNPGPRSDTGPSIGGIGQT